MSLTSLRRTINQYLVHYPKERNHQGLDNQLIDPEARIEGNGGMVEVAKAWAECLSTTTELQLRVALQVGGLQP